MLCRRKGRYGHIDNLDSVFRMKEAAFMIEQSPVKKPVIFSGIQPSGSITLGNYIGAIRNFTILDKDYDCLYCVVDLHALTLRQDPAALRRRTLELAALYIAAGLDPDKNIIYCQSHVSAHAELAWILNCYTYTGELSRMTQFKEKSQKHTENINAGLYTYPVLMAADILLYQADLVPVGADQKQHIEITRDIATRFNGIYGEVFKLPEPYIPVATAKIMSLAEPTRKMSKSDADDSFVALLDEPDVIRRKFRRAVTDSDGEIRPDADKKPGVTNLLTVMSVLTGESVSSICVALSGKGYGALKDAVADAVVDVFSPIQKKYREIIADKQYLDGVMKTNAERARTLAVRTLRKVYKKVGLYQ
jgi:tryptophanyl-tRNA synthetase